MRIRDLIALLLLLVLPLQAYAGLRMSLFGPECAMHVPAAPAVQAEAGMPCHETQPTTHAPAQPDHPACVKCPLCALHAGALTLAPVAFATQAPRHRPGGLFAEPATVYLDLPLPVPRG